MNKAIIVILGIIVLVLAVATWLFTEGPIAKRERIKIVFETLDLNKDKRLSAEELKQAKESLMVLDLDGSGYLEEMEIGGPTAPINGMVRTQTVVRVLDKNGDLAISSDELLEAESSLLRLDENHNGKLENLEIFRPNPLQGNLRTMARLLNYDNEATGDVLPGEDDRQYDGYMLYYESNMVQDIQLASTVYLINKTGNTVHQWENKRNAPEGVGAYLLENGLLLRCSATGGWLEMHKYPVGAWDIVELVDWDGNVVWEYQYSDENSCLHHDVEPLPNGNILVNAYEGKTMKEATELGWQRQGSYDGLVWFESIYELKPNMEDGTTEIVWEWHSWDHLVQDHDPDAPNYGSIAENLGKIDVNYEKLGAKVYSRGQLMHTNAIDYNEKLDQILLSACIYGEVWMISHHSTTAEAAGEKGDLLYRWGRPEAVKKGGKEDNILYWQHDINWISDTLPHRGDILVFNNGSFRAEDGTYRGTNKRMGFGETYSDILEVKLPLNEDGTYRQDGEAEIVWSYNSDTKDTDFFSPFMSGARRLPNGNTIAVTAYNKRIYEITPQGERVMDYYVPGGGQLYRVYKYPKDYPAFRGRF